MKYPCTGVILAGGLNRRFYGRTKAFIRVGGTRILDHIYDIFSDLFKEIILVTNNPIQFIDWDVYIVTDLFPLRSALTGIHSGLFFANYSHVFVSACDTPFLMKEIVVTIVEQIGPKVDVVIPETSAGLEPLSAVYSKKCLSIMERHLVQNKLKIQRIFQKGRIRKVQEATLREKDPDLLSFFNVNTPEDFDRARKIEAEKRSIKESE